MAKKRKKIIRLQEEVSAGMNVYEIGLQRTREIYELFSDVWVSFSGGKDSTVVLELAREVAREMGRLPVNVNCYDEEAIDPDTEAYIRSIADDPEINFRWTCAPIKHRNACSREHPYWRPWDPSQRDKWIRPLPDHPSVEACVEDAPHPRPFGGAWADELPNLAQSLEYNAAEPWQQKTGGRIYVLGLRAEESMRRRRIMMQREHRNYLGKSVHGVALGSPIYDWMVGDVWKYINDIGCGFSNAYQLMRYAGVKPRDQRVAHPFGEEPLESLWRWRLCYPETWDRIPARVPGAATAAEWGRSALFGKRGAHQLYAGWEEDPRAALTEAIEAWPKLYRKMIRTAISAQIRMHEQMEPGVPIPLEKHGDSGVTWAKLIALAHRGDFKGRAVDGITTKRYKSFEKK